METKGERLKHGEVLKKQVHNAGAVFWSFHPPIELPSYSNNLSRSLICVWYRRIASPLEQNPPYIAENVDPPPPHRFKLLMIAGLYLQSSVCSATGKGFSTAPFNRGPRSLQPLSADPLIDVLWDLLWLTAIFICC